MSYHSKVRYIADGVLKVYTVTFPYLSKNDVHVYLNDALKTSYTWVNETSIQFETVPPKDTVILIARETPKESRLVNFENTSTLTETILDLDSDQVFYLIQENRDFVEDVVVFIDDFKDLVGKVETDAALAVKSAADAKGSSLASESWKDEAERAAELAYIYASTNSLKTYPSIAALKNAAIPSNVSTTLPKVPQTAIVEGYYEVGDKAGVGTFVWEEGSTLPDNGGTVIASIKSTTGRWHRIYDDVINVHWFGAKGDGQTDDAPRIQAAINALLYRQVLEFNSQSIYALAVTLHLPYDKSIRGNKCIITKCTTSSLTRGFLLSINSTDVLSCDVDNPEKGAFVDGIDFIAGDNEGVRGIFCASNVVLSNLNFDSLSAAILTADQYLEYIKWENIQYFNYGIPDEIVFHTGDNGTTRIIKSVKCEVPENFSYCFNIGNNIKTVSINDYKGSGFNLKGRSAIAIRDSYLYLNSSICAFNVQSLVIENTTFIVSPKNHPLEFKSDPTYARTCSNSLKNLRFVYDTYINDYTGSDFIELYSDNQNMNIVIENCYKYIAANDEYTPHILYAIKTNLQTFESLPRENACFSSSIGANRVSRIKTGDSPSLLGADTHTEYDYLSDDGGAWYYRVIQILDEDRKLGNVSNEIFTTPSREDGAAIIGLADVGFSVTNSSYDIYKGTGTNSYSYRARVSPTSPLIIDNGISIGCNIKTMFANPPTPVPTYTDCMKLITRSDTPNNVTAYLTALPTRGSWIVGDKVMKLNPLAGNWWGYVCVASGTPGTWKSLGVVST